jgi:hypothetical protein
LWPKFQLSPYYKQGDILPAVVDPIQVPEVDAPGEEPVAPARLPHLISAVLSHRTAEVQVVVNSPLHVRNQIYMVRWQARPHSDNCEMPYDAVWQDPAFRDYVEGSNLQGFVSPAQALDRHRVHVQQLLGGNRNPDDAMPIANADVQAQVLRDYVPLADAVARPHAQALARARDQPALELAADVQHRLAPALQQPPARLLEVHPVQQAEQPHEVIAAPPLRQSARPRQRRVPFDL